jgi:glycine/D-amino acid oxidase-like deaminating enzyme
MPSRSDDIADLVVVGGGVMGLFTAYHASQRFERVVVLERGRIGDPLTASYGRTRSFRNDYL